MKKSLSSVPLGSDYDTHVWELSSALANLSLSLSFTHSPIHNLIITFIRLYPTPSCTVIYIARDPFIYIASSSSADVLLMLTCDSLAFLYTQIDGWIYILYIYHKLGYEYLLIYILRDDNLSISVFCILLSLFFRSSLLLSLGLLGLPN